MAGFATEIVSSMTDCALSTYIINVSELKEVGFHINGIDNVIYRRLDA